MLCARTAVHGIRAYWGRRFKRHSFLTSALLARLSSQLHAPATLASMNMELCGLLSWPGYWKTEKSFATAGNGTLDPLGHSPFLDCSVCEGQSSRLL